jgi:hypothetical protein
MESSEKVKDPRVRGDRRVNPVLMENLRNGRMVPRGNSDLKVLLPARSVM